MKEGLKKKISKKQDGRCALSGERLSSETELFDTDRVVPKAEGGIYTDENTQVADPVAHMVRHGSFRLRDDDLAELKSFIDDREQVMKLRNKVDNQLRAAKRRTDDLHEDTINFLEEELERVESVLKNRTQRVVKWVKVHQDEDPLITSALGVYAVGEMTVAYCMVYIDLEKAAHASSLWAYAGLDRPSHDRYTKGETSGGNKSLRCALWNMAKSQVKLGGPYRVVYDAVKRRLSVSKKLTKSRNTEGQLREMMWKDTKPCHRDGAALRIIMKHFLADYWMVGRILLGLPTDPLYAESVLGHTKIIRPAERGWRLEFKRTKLQGKPKI